MNKREQIEKRIRNRKLFVEYGNILFLTKKKRYLFLRPGLVYFTDSKSYGLWIDFQNEYLESPLQGPFLLSQKEWNNILNLGKIQDGDQTFEVKEVKNQIVLFYNNFPIFLSKKDWSKVKKTIDSAFIRFSKKYISWENKRV